MLLSCFQYFHDTQISTQDNDCNLGAIRLQFYLRTKLMGYTEFFKFEGDVNIDRFIFSFFT